MANEIHWSSDIYRRVRQRFYEIDDTNRLFNIELQQYKGEVVELEPKHPLADEVVDLLGMNNRHKIVFHDEQLYMMFLLKWS